MRGERRARIARSTRIHARTPLRSYRDASRRYAERALAEGNSLYLCTGGEAESLLSEKGKDKVVLSHRKGFIRLALSYGADLVPTYGFGNTDTYATYGFGLKFRLWLSKNFQIALPLFHGRWLTMTPYPATLTVRACADANSCQLPM